MNERFTHQIPYLEVVMTPEQRIYNLIQMYSKALLILDLRTPEDYTTIHLPDSVSVPCTNFIDEVVTSE